jgi:hypothetical protein
MWSDLATANTGCGKLTSFFEYEMPYEKGSYLAAPVLDISSNRVRLVTSTQKNWVIFFCC